ncbi:TRAP transporter small permease [Petrocella sp. FN5]|uniref:TRAP transporter small permease n=1 Tax=Petrocella sp. FN5 TaxID=3032002 RepID=UPI0023DCCECF|nr:TRAP transporter small permease subunit [Petrocella sp. FN5]MDF1616849.1 TRAP transporter small permease subunit [Petrocella sp. FN5]
MLLLSLLQIFLRYFSFLGLRLFTWGDEIVRLSSIWVVFLAASLGVKEKAHLSVAFFLEKYLPKKLMVSVQNIASLIVIVTQVFLIYYGSRYALNAVGKTLQNIDMSIAWFYAAIPVGCFYLLMDYILILVYKEHPYSRKKLSIDKN